ncbi:MAG TPA: STN domain-containing protein [Burkholderiaceae bacterium]|nr:STN domain-containing protein [Burkholderiaceae bacterium]
MPALAATSGVPPAAVIEFDIPAGPLAVTLIEIGRVSGRLVSFPPELVARLVAPSVQGRLTLSQALIPAAQPSGLAVDVTPGGVVTVRGVPVLPATAGDDLCACWMAALPSCRPQTARSNRRIPRTVSGRARPDGRKLAKIT